MTEQTETGVTEQTSVKERKYKEDDQLSKRDLMDLIEGLVTDSGIRKAKLWNPYDEIISGGAKTLSVEDEYFKKAIKAPDNQEMPPGLIPDVAFSSTTRVQLGSWGLVLQESSGNVSLGEDAFEKEKGRRRTVYLQWGRERLKIFKAGNCSIFAAVTLGLLSGEKALGKLPGSIVIEQFNFVSSDGHAFLVVNRSGGTKTPKGTLTDPASWGPDAFVIDAWYANQKREKLDRAGTTAVKNVTGKDGDAYYDKAFLDWLKQYAFRVPTAFTYKIMAAVPG